MKNILTEMLVMAEKVHVKTEVDGFLKINYMVF